MNQQPFFIEKLSRLLFILFLMLTAVGCGDSGGEIVPDEEQPEITLSASPTSFSFGAEGGSQSLSISSNSTWRINFESTDWCKPSIQTAKGNASVTLTAEANPLEETRTLNLSIAATGAETASIQCTQEAKEAEPTEPEKEDYIEPDNSNMSNLTSVEFASQMGLGWNLGNSLEAISVNGDNLTGSETSWGNPVVTKTLIDGVKAAGFNTIRIPVSWSHQLDDITTYKISWAWKQRVEEVINYALVNDMFVMINIHWDGGWMDHPAYDHQEAINTKLAALWKQIAVYFRDYDDHLLFAGTNEVHVEGNYGNPSNENIEVQNSFNQTFVETIRATGGRNSYRYLVVQGYNTNIDHTVNHFILPTDNIPNRLLAEVHFYDPYDFTLMETGDYKTQWGEGFTDVSSWGQEAWVDEAFEKMKTNFIDQGIAVILGEYAAILRDLPVGQEEHISARNHYLNYINTTAVDKGLVPCYWDNGNTGPNGSGIFDRSTGEIIHQDMVEALTNLSD